MRRNFPDASYHRHMERKRHWSAYDLSGMTSDERDGLIVTLKRKGWSARRIAARIDPPRCARIQHLTAGVQFQPRSHWPGQPRRITNPATSR
jgi:hypothetical protein